MPIFTLGILLSLLFGFYLPVALHVILPPSYLIVATVLLSVFNIHRASLLGYFSFGVMLGTLLSSCYSAGYYQYDFIQGQNRQYQIIGEITNNQLPVDCSLNQPVCFNTLHIKPIKIGAAVVEQSLYSPTITVHTDQIDAELQKGNILSFTAKLNRPLGYENDFGFNYAKWAFANGIYAKGKTLGAIEVIKDKSSYSQRLITTIHSEINPYLYSEYFYPLLFAENKTLSSEQKEQLQIHGLSHLFAISGLHIGILYLLASFVFKVVMSLFQAEHKFIWIRFFSILVVWGYVGLISFPVPASRAAVLLSIWLCLTSTNLNINKLNIFCLMLVVTLVMQPTGVIDVSWWLSIWAVAGIFVYYHLFITPSGYNQTSLLHKFTQTCQFQWFLATWLVPLTIFWFHGVSISGFWLNLILIPIFCILLIPSLFTAAFLSIAGFKHLSNLLFQFSDMIFFVNEELISSLSFGVEWIGIPKGLVVLMITAAVLVLFRPLLTRLHVCTVAVFASSLLMFNFINSTHGNLKLHVFDVGQGTSVLIYRQGQGILYDLGPQFVSGFSATEAVVAPNLLGLGIKQLEQVIISHSDSDHSGDIRAINDFASNIYSTACPSETITWQQITIRALWPSAGDDLSQYSDNDTSCVLKITDHLSGFSALLTGDITNKVEAKLVRLHHDKEIDLQADVIFSPHHGSKHSSSYPFLKAVKANYVIHTAGVFNHFNFPTDETKQRANNLGMEQYSTSNFGQITIVFDHLTGIIEVETLLNLFSPFWKKQNPFSFQLEIR